MNACRWCLIAVAATILWPAGGWAAPAWKFLYAEDTLKMYAAPDEPVATFKAEGTIPVNLLDLLAVVADVTRRKEWLPDLRESRILEGEVTSRVVIYERIHMPWPIADRDCVVESKVRIDYEAGTVEVAYQQTAHPAKPPVDGLIRLPIVRGRTFYRFVDDHTTHASYEAALDVGGALPEWAVKMAIKNVPIKTLHAVTRQVHKTRGTYEKFLEPQRARFKFSRPAAPSPPPPNSAPPNTPPANSAPPPGASN